MSVTAYSWCGTLGAQSMKISYISGLAHFVSQSLLIIIVLGFSFRIIVVENVDVETLAIILSFI